MNDSRQEYLNPAEPKHKKVFQLAPVEDDLTATIIGTRRQACEDPDLSDGAKVLFTWLLDASFSRSANRRPGVITVSTTKLSEKLHRSRRAIYKWKKELTNKLLIWITHWFMPNTWPIDTYHISTIDPPDHDPKQMMNGDGMWGNGVRRSAVAPGPRAREPGQLPLSAVVKRPENPFRGTKRPPEQSLLRSPSNPNSSNLPENATVSGKKEHLSVAKFATGSSTKQHLSVAKFAPGSGTKGHAAVAQNDTLKETVDRGTGSPEVDLGGSAPPKGRKDWEKKLKKLFPRELEALKTDLLKQQRGLAPGDPLIPDLSCRLEAIDVALYGAKRPQSQAKPQPRPARSAPTPKEATEEELLEGAHYLVSTNQERLLTKAQKELLTKERWQKKAAVEKAGA